MNFFHDSYSHWTTLAEGQSKWTYISNGTLNATPRRANTRYSICGTEDVINHGLGYQCPVSQEDVTFTVGTAIYRGGASNTGIAFCSDNGHTVHLTVCADTNGSIFAARGTSGGTVLARSNPNLVPTNTWMYLEAKVTLNGSTGTVDVQLDGVAIAALHLTGQNTKNGGTKTTFDTVNLFYNGNSGYACDTYMNNTAGATNTGFLGDCVVDALLPSGAGQTTQLTPTNPTNVNWSNVANVPANDAEFNSTATSGNLDLYALTPVQALPSSAATVFAISVNTRAFKSTTDPIGVMAAFRTQSTNYAGLAGAGGDSFAIPGGADPQYVSMLPALYRQFMDTNPNTGVAWTIPDVAALQAGAEVHT